MIFSVFLFTVVNFVNSVRQSGDVDNSENIEDLAVTETHEISENLNQTELIPAGSFEDVFTQRQNAIELFCSEAKNEIKILKEETRECIREALEIIDDYSEALKKSEEDLAIAKSEIVRLKFTVLFRRDELYMINHHWKTLAQRQANIIEFLNKKIQSLSKELAHLKNSEGIALTEAEAFVASLTDNDFPSENVSQNLEESQPVEDAETVEQVSHFSKSDVQS